MSARRYAEGTEVSAEKSRAEIETLMRKHGASQFVSGYDEVQAMIGATLYGRQIRLVVRKPAPSDLQPTKSRRTQGQLSRALEKEGMRRWRAQLLLLKAQLELVATGERTFDHVFAMDIVLPDGSTTGEHVLPKIEEAYRLGKMGPLLPQLPAKGET